jgi:hypothetical protein
MLLALALLTTQDVNPRYEAWADCKPESWVKVKMLMKTPQMEMTTEAVTKLIEKTDEKVVVETTTKIKFGDREMTPPARKEEISRKPDPKAAAPKELGEEDVAVGGKTLKCKVYDWEMEAGPGQKAKGKAWVSKEIPGGMAKGEFQSEKVPDPIKIEAVEWEKK